MAMLLDMSYNQAYWVMSALINLPKKAGCYLSLFGERLAMGRKKNSGIRLTSTRSRFKWYLIGDLVRREVNLPTQNCTGSTVDSLVIATGTSLECRGESLLPWDWSSEEIEPKRDASFTRFVSILRNVVLQRNPSAGGWLIHFLIHPFIHKTPWAAPSPQALCCMLDTPGFTRQGLCSQGAYTLMGDSRAYLSKYAQDSV